MKYDQIMGLTLLIILMFMGNAFADTKKSTPNQSDNQCSATYAADEGTLTIPCVKVLNSAEEPQFYAAELQQIPETEPLQFSVIGITDTSDENQYNSCVATFDDGTLFLPCLDILEPNGDIQFYEMTLEQTTSMEPFIFMVIAENHQTKAKTPRGTREKSYRTVLGDFNGVTVHSNGSSDYASGERSIVNGKDVGLKWQCVEYVNRYYLNKFGINLRDKHSNHAKTFWGNASKMQLARFSNGETTAPQVGDIAVSDSGTYGHVAIVRSVSDNQLCVAQQNVYQTSNDVNACTTLGISNGKYTVGYFDNTTPITGWLRLKTVDISRNGQNIVDDKDDALWNGGTQSYWKIGNGTGYNSRVLYTYANASSNEDNYCKWNVNIVDAGNYEVSAYVPNNYATSQQAKYKIWTGNQVEYSTINQQNYSNQWVKLGEYNFQAGIVSIKLSDNTGEASSLKRMLACDAIKFTYKANNDGGYQWHGNGSIISYHGRFLPTDGWRAFGIIKDTVQLHQYSGKPVGLFQWQVNESSCNKLKLYAEDLPSSDNKVDITIGTWDYRSSDITFPNVKLPFVLAKSNTGGARFQMDNGDWYVVKVALHNILTQNAKLHAICTTDVPFTSYYKLGGGDSTIIDGGYQWNGSGSIISHMFAGTSDMRGDWPHGAFKDTLKVRRSPEKPMVFFQWQRNDICPRLTFDAQLGASEKRVDIHVKDWNASNDAATVHRGVTLPYTISDYSANGNWHVIQIKFLKPVSYTANVTAKCSGID
jgi:surface antigen